LSDSYIIHYSGGLGYNFVYTPDASGDYNYSGSSLPLWNTSNGGVNSIPQPTGYTGNIIGADGAYQIGAISQSISGLTVGQNYTVSFYYAGAQQESFTGATTEAWTVGFGSAPTQETPVLSNANQSFTGWYSDSLTFTATGTTYVLSFLADGTPDGKPPFSLLAGVDVEPVPTPEPSSIIGGGLVLLALGGSTLRKFRQQKQA